MFSTFQYARHTLPVFIFNYHVCIGLRCFQLTLFYKILTLLSEKDHAYTYQKFVILQIQTLVPVHVVYCPRHVMF